MLPNLEGLSVLTVDDEADIRLQMEIWLKEAGHTVVAAAEGAAARACLGQKQFDRVVTDVLMPKTDGLGLIAEIKKVQPSARIVAISGGGRYLDGTDCLKMATGLGAYAAVIKPFNRCWPRSAKLSPRSHHRRLGRRALVFGGGSASCLMSLQ